MKSSMPDSAFDDEHVAALVAGAALHIDIIFVRPEIAFIPTYKHRVAQVENAPWRQEKAFIGNEAYLLK